MGKLKAVISVMLIMLFLTVTGCGGAPVSAEVTDPGREGWKAKTAITVEKQERVETILYDKVKKIQETIRLKVNNIKTVKDFNGGEYIVTECEPSGYTVFHPDSGVFCESSESAPSPYIGLYSDELYYAGPTEYYIKTEDGKYRHTVLNETIDEEWIPSYEKLSHDTEELLMSEKNDKNLKLLNTGDLNEFNKPNIQKVVSGSLPSNQVDWFKYLSVCGYWDGGSGSDGVCGYVALNMLFAFLDKFKDDNFINNKYWLNFPIRTGLVSGIGSLTRYLRYNCGGHDSTISADIHWIANNYRAMPENSNVPAYNCVDLAIPFFNRYTIRNLINAGKPVILFGNLKEPQGYVGGTGKKNGHAVVCYSYADASYKCHYGWTGYTDVDIEGTLGSIYAAHV